MPKYLDYYNKSDLIMWVDLSTHCNAACPQCHRTNPDGLGKSKWLPIIQWSLSEFKTAFPIESMQNFSGFEFCGTWGDPMMNKDIFKIIEYVIKNSNCTIMVNTNGSIRNQEWWWDLGVLCGNRLNVTFDIDGINQTQHSKYRRKTSLDIVVDNLTSISNTRTTTRVFTVVFKHNQDNLYDIALLSKECGAEAIFFVPSNRFHKRVSNKFNFIDEKGDGDYLEQSNFDSFGDIFWKDLFLDNDEDLKRIKEFTYDR
jgi:MoaA/NifB/PqqE/SkfB family radical SAM enzyme